MMDAFDGARRVAQTMLSGEDMTGPLKRERIGEIVDQVLTMPSFAGVDREALVRDLEGRFMISIARPTALEDRSDHKPWLPDRRGSIEWKYWDRYRLMLEPKLPPNVLRQLDGSIDEVLGRIEDPLREGVWDRRGLVMGNVQSGKTSHYTGLICKAADAGYKVIIVLAGMHNNLRSQTQIRLDEGFLGYRSAPAGGGAREPVGVGLFDQRVKPNSITHRLENGDFSMTVARSFQVGPSSVPLLFVVKKNASVLKNLVTDWVDFASNAVEADTNRKIVENVPLLVIDDEADHGSVDTVDGAVDAQGQVDPDHDPTRINQRIRELLRAFRKSAYVGYTATPFANIFIHDQSRTEALGDDLFPRSFIVNLQPPSDYMGPARVFGLPADGEDGEDELGLPLVRLVRDYVEARPVPPTHDWSKIRRLSPQSLTRLAAANPRQIEGDNIAGRLDVTWPEADAIYNYFAKKYGAWTGWMPPKHRNGHVPTHAGARQLPPSLHVALWAFLLTCAARRVRGQHPAHNSMLVHVTRFTNVQEEVFNQVDAAVADMLRRLKYGEGAAVGSLRASLRSLWERDFVPTSTSMGVTPTTWDDIEPHLVDVAGAITVRQINGSAGDVLDYDDHEKKKTALTVIAVGGEKLSRGLTLEGLTVSYFLRSTRMYDTLLQMGRWFGYRPGYEDLCRLYIPRELQHWFEHIAVASEELRREFDQMAATGGTPTDYGLRVQAHPVLMITSSVKMRHHTELRLSYAGTVAETTVFHRDAATNDANYGRCKRFLVGLGLAADPQPPARSRPGGATHTWPGARLWENVPADQVRAFLASLQTHPDAYKVNGTLLSRYIEGQNSKGRLGSWTVILLTGDGNDAPGLPVKCSKRAWKENVDSTGPRYVIRRLLSPKDEAIDLDETAYKTALDASAAIARVKGKAAPKLPSGPEIRARRPSTRGLLLVYLLDPTADKTGPRKSEGDAPIVGIGVSFPKDLPGGVTYKVNNIYWQQEMGADAEEADANEEGAT